MSKIFKSYKILTRVIHQMCADIPQQYIHVRHMLSMYTRYLVVDATPGGCTNETKLIFVLNLN